MHLYVYLHAYQTWLVIIILFANLSFTYPLLINIYIST